MHQVTVTGLNRVINQRANKGGSTVLASFDCEVNGFELIGCALVRTPKNGMVVWPPKLEAPGATRRIITITDNSLRHQMLEAARVAYRALGGTNAEWIPSKGPDRAQLDVEVVGGEDIEGMQRFLASPVR